MAFKDISRYLGRAELHRVHKSRPPSKMPLRVCVVGCGPGGLVACKELKEEGFEVVCFDQQAHIGGVFSWAWETLQMTSSFVHTVFSGALQLRIQPAIMS